MATAFTHAFVGAALATVAPKPVPVGRLALTLAILAAAPDLDVIAFSLGIPYAHPLGHRGVTHSLLYAAVLAPLVTLLFRHYVTAFSGAWWKLCGLVFLASASHGFLDAFTDAGLGVGFFIPIENSRYFFPFRPLATSPIGVEAFFTERAWRILANEFTWVWLPTLVGMAIAFITRRGMQASSQAQRARQASQKAND